MCPACGHITVDVWAVLPVALNCHVCGAAVERAWAFVSAPGITPQGTRPERNTNPKRGLNRVNTKAIAAETTFEIQEKWKRYGDEKLAEQHVSREINHKAGMADEVGNPIPLPKPAPITTDFMKAHGG